MPMKVVRLDARHPLVVVALLLVLAAVVLLVVTIGLGALAIGAVAAGVGLLARGLMRVGLLRSGGGAARPRATPRLDPSMEVFSTPRDDARRLPPERND
jgi:hypothetical protein